MVAALWIAVRKSAEKEALFISASLLLFSFFFVLDFDIGQLRYPRLLASSLPFVRLAFTALLVIAPPFVFYRFPYRTIRPRWLYFFLVMCVATTALFLLTEAYGSTWQRSGGRLQTLADWTQQFGWYLWIGSWLLSMGAGLAGQITRYRATRGQVQRQQTLLLLVGLSAILLTLLITWLLEWLPNGVATRRHAGQHSR
jgi:hypothetical protein